MSKKSTSIKGAFSLVLALSVCAVLPSGAMADPGSDEVKNPSQQLLEARSGLESLEVKAALAVEAYNQAVVDKAAADAAAVVALEKYDAAALLAADAKDALGDYAASAYKNSGGDDSMTQINGILASGTPAEAARGVEMVSYVQGRKADVLVESEKAAAVAANAKKASDDAQALADDLALTAETAALDAERLSNEAAAAVVVLETDELEKQRIAEEEAAAAAAYAAWEAEQATYAFEAAQAAAAAPPALDATGAAVPTVTAPVAAPTASAGLAIEFALSQTGKPYVWGATGPDGYDCSGLTGAAYAAAGVPLPRTSKDQARSGTAVPVSEIQPGDLVFFGSPVHHVGIYMGDGLMVHAPKPGDVVKVSKFWTPPTSAVRVS